MNKNNLFPVLVSVVLLCYSCTSNKSGHEEPSEQLVEANEIHQKSLDLREEIMELEKQLKANEIAFSELKEELKIWDKEIIEVPGFEHSHDDEHQRAYHVHNRMKPFSDEEHLNYQKAMHEEISDLHKKFTRLAVIGEEIMD